MKRLHFLQTLFASVVLVACGSSGGDDPEPIPAPPTPTVTAPTVVSTTPANNATDISIGVTNIQVVYDKDVLMSSDASLQPKVSGATLSGSASVSGKTLSFAVNCSDYETKVTIILPKGLIGVTGALANEYTFSFTTAKKPVISDNDAVALAKKLGWGWNLGNHFDTSSGEDGKHPQWGYWDNAKPTQTLYTNLKKAGASTVRIGVTWGNYQNTTTWDIEADYMAEVKQNVEWAEAAGLNVILNLHHDEYWLDIKGAANSSNINTAVKDRIEKTWKQIAEAFKDKGDFLFFESFNEIQDGNWGWGDNLKDGGKQYNTLNEWNQLVVNTIRATGGKNATRWIGIPAYASSPSFALENSFALPNDAANKIMVSVHFYDPNTFTLTPESNGGKSEWGHTAASGKAQSGSNEEHVVEIFQKLQEKYIAKNIPVYIGEYGCVMHKNDRSNLFRNYYLEYVCRAAHTYNMPLCIWDNNSEGGGDEHHGYFNHNDGTYLNNMESLVQTMIKAATSDDANYTLESIYNNAPK
jgi:endoglucanase